MASPSLTVQPAAATGSAATGSATGSAAIDSAAIDSAPIDTGLFGPDSVTWRIHQDPSMAVAGLRALLLQACHPTVMAGFLAHSGYRDDPWGRLRRTGEWVATVAFGTTAEAEAAGAGLRRGHASLRPFTDPVSGRLRRVDEPDLLLWVHCTEVESFLSTYRRCGGRLAAGDGDRYVAQMSQSARLVGLDPEAVPHTEAELAAYYRLVRPELKVTSQARVHALLGFVPRMPAWVQLATPARPAWAAMVLVGAGLLPRWARRLYGLPGLVTTDLTAVVAARGLRTTLLALPEDLVGSPAARRARQRLTIEHPV